MERSIRGGALVIAAAIGAAGFALPLAQPASATTPHVACSKLVSTTTINTTNNTGTTSSSLSLCTPTALKAGGTSKVTVPISQLTATITTKLTWRNGKGTTTEKLKYTTQKTIGKCPAGTKYRTIITGTTKTSTGAAAKIVKPGETISAQVCTKVVTATKYTSTLLPGTKFKL